MNHKSLSLLAVGSFLRIFRPRPAIRDFILWPLLSRLVGVSHTRIQPVTRRYSMEVGMEDVLNRFLLVYAPTWDPCWEPQTTKLAQLIASFSKRVIVAGGHIGYTALQILDVGLYSRSALVMDVCEPVPWLADRLRKNIRLNNLESHVQVHQIALSAENGSADIFVDSIRSSLVAGSHGIKEVVQTRSLVSLDSVHESIPVDFLFLDIEGYELPVLRAAEGKLAKEKPEMILEISPKILNKTNITENDIYDFLEGLGYTVYLIRDDYQLEQLPEILHETVQIIQRQHPNSKSIWNQLYFNIYATTLSLKAVKERLPSVDVVGI